MANVIFKYHGVEDLQRSLRVKIPKKIVGGVREAMEEIAGFMEKEVKESIAGRRAEERSVDTGLFLRSPNGYVNQYNEAIIQSNVKYAEFLEAGTSRIPKRGHFQNSLARNRTKIRGYLREKLSQKL